MKKIKIIKYADPVEGSEDAEKSDHNLFMRLTQDALKKSLGKDGGVVTDPIPTPMTPNPATPSTGDSDSLYLKLSVTLAEDGTVDVTKGTNDDFAKNIGNQKIGNIPYGKIYNEIISAYLAKSLQNRSSTQGTYKATLPDRKITHSYTSSGGAQQTEEGRFAISVESRGNNEKAVLTIEKLVESSTSRGTFERNPDATPFTIEISEWKNGVI